MSKTSIEWSESVWNPTAGCDKVSPGCKSCYAIREARRLAGNPNPKISDSEVYRDKSGLCEPIIQGDTYRTFLASKSQADQFSGFDPLWMPSFLFNFQAALVDCMGRECRSQDQQAGTDSDAASGRTADGSRGREVRHRGEAITRRGTQRRHRGDELREAAPV
jgi:hypothetical protein